MGNSVILLLFPLIHSVFFFLLLVTLRSNENHRRFAFVSN